MNASLSLLRLLAFIPLIGLANVVAAQPGGPHDQSNHDGTGAPDWLVWQIFHDSLEFYEKQSPQTVVALLKDRVALIDNQTSGFMSAGRDYLRRLAAIDDEARAEIFARYGAELAPQQLQKFAARPEDLLRPGVRQPTQGLLPGTTRDGRTIRELLQAGGFIAEVEARRHAALQLHLETLKRSFGNDTLEKTRAWVAAEVAPAVRTIATPPPVVVRGITPANHDALQPR